MKNYLELTVVSALLNQTTQLGDFGKTIKHFSKKVEALNFSDNAYLTNAHLLTLKNCKNVKVLDLEACQAITDAGLAHLAPLTALQCLDLRVCKNLTDDGLARFKTLASSTNLRIKFN